MYGKWINIFLSDNKDSSHKTIETVGTLEKFCKIV